MKNRFVEEEVKKKKKEIEGNEEDFKQRTLRIENEEENMEKTERRCSRG